MARPRRTLISIEDTPYDHRRGWVEEQILKSINMATYSIGYAHVNCACIARGYFHLVYDAFQKAKPNQTKPNQTKPNSSLSIWSLLHETFPSTDAADYGMH